MRTKDGEGLRKQEIYASKSVFSKTFFLKGINETLEEEELATAEIIEPVKAFNNSSLFSNHYLENMVQKTPEWGDEARLSEVYARIKAIFDRKGKNFERYVEAELEHNLIRPVFDILGHHYGVQEGLHGDPLKPDYALFPDQETLDEAYTHNKGSEDFYKKAIAVGDAKAWNVLLDKSRQGKAQREMTNPSFQIDVYLRATPPKWAILTNGRLWRLYHEDTSYKLDCYYEINLPELIDKIEKTGDVNPFKYFYLFFRLDAFPQIPLGSSFLDRVREESSAYAQKIGDDLQENVYKAMKVLAEGFLAETSNELSRSDEDIRNIQDNSLRLLYRLLFIFYAESRKLLDVDNKHYREISLRKLKDEVADKLDRAEAMLSVRSTYWEGLRDLFRLINDGSEAFGIPKDEFYIPAYNGGLFDPSVNPFLVQKRIGNSYLARAIDLLARSKGEDGMASVDYSSLDIRHLGSIYEGILEYRLHLAGEPMVTVKEKGKEIWMPEREASGKKALDHVQTDGIYLVTDKGERKATGSYYTPDYIVKYIVANTLEPLMKKKMEDCLWSGGSYLKALLSIKVLDPAMGSGHFLVEATDRIAKELVHARETARPEEEGSEEIAEHDIQWARREVVRNCIYGVDLNPMAVELAKLSLWLTTVASNKPLSFLDHHLRCGNSLIGAKLSDLLSLPNAQRDPGQLPMWQFVLKQQKEHTEGMLKQYSEMAAQPDDDLRTVKEKEQKYRELRGLELSRRINELANIWLSIYFGNNVEEYDYEELQNQLSPNRFPDWSNFRELEWFKSAQTLAEERRFFHWELEFPEAFRSENAGFDVVIGNPPYDVLAEKERREDLSQFMNFIKSSEELNPALGNKIDLYRLMIAKACSIGCNESQLGFIVPMSILADQQTVNLRKYLINSFKIKMIDAFPQKDDPTRRVFPEAKLPTSVIIFEKSHEDYGFFPVITHPGRYLSEISGTYLCDKSLAEMLDKDYFPIPLLSSDLASNILRKLYYRFDWICLIDNLIQTYQGEINETTLASLLSTNAAIGPKVLRGGNVQRYEFLEEARQGIDKYLDVQRYEQQIGGQRVAHTKNPRIGYQRNAALDNWRRLIFTELPSQSYCFDSISYFPITDKKKDYALLALLNSNLFEWRFRLTSTNNHVSTKEIARLPAIRFDYGASDAERTGLVQELKGFYNALCFEEVCSNIEAHLPIDTQGSLIPEKMKLDVVQDFLAFLAEQMLEMNKEKRQEIEGFLTWLEGYVGAKVDDLTPKTRLQTYYDSDFDAFLEVLKKNRKKLAIDPARREPSEALRAEFEGSVSKLSPLRERIEKTAYLIDLIVYRLYGLTNDEIKIVEGGTNAA